MREDNRKYATTIPPDNSEPKSKPNWREAFEQALARGGEPEDGCRFCATAGEDKARGRYDCAKCVIGPSCTSVFDTPLDNFERRAGCRYVLKHTQDFTDTDEIRGHIADALTILGKDELREEFVGKAEEKKRYGCFDSDGGGMTYRREGASSEHEPKYEPDLRYTLREGTDENVIGTIIAAFHTKDRRDEYLDFLKEKTDA